MADEKYRLTLEGSEIDEALLRLANYEDEGLVLGSRKGVMLGPGSEYYHKNARYYAELAQSAVPGDTTSAVRWDIDQSALTDADRELARKNIRAGGSNPNLLDNPWWGSGEVVNQRQVTSGTTPDNKYFIDRWMTLYSGAGGASGTYSIGSGGISFTPYTGALNGAGQKLSNPNAVRGKTCTASILLSDGTIKSASAIVPTSGAVTFNMGNNYNASITTADLFRVFVPASTIRAVKLELGSVSTLANDVPPDYETELLKCMRYFVRFNLRGNSVIGYGYANSATGVYGEIILPVPMRALPTITTTTALIARCQGTSANITSISCDAPRANHLRLSLGTSNMTSGYPVIIGTGSSENTMDLSADL